MASAPVLRISIIAAKPKHPKWSHNGCLPLAGAFLLMNPSAQSMRSFHPGQQSHSHTLPGCGSAPGKQSALGFQSQREISFQSNCDLMGAFRGFSEEEVTNTYFGRGWRSEVSV